MTTKLTKQDQELINEEVERYQATHRAIVNEAKHKGRQLIADESLARELTSQVVNTQREEDKQALQSDEYVAHGLTKLRLEQTRALALLLEQPYFARVVYHEGGRDVEFKLGLASFPEQRIIDWRKAPISKLYYDYEEGEEFDTEIAGVERHGVIKLRRAYQGQKDILSAIELSDRSYVQKHGEWFCHSKIKAPSFSLKDKEKIKELLAEYRKGHIHEFQEDRGYLQQILSLLSADQFCLISTETDKPVIIQGSAGTGKTTVALHRLAWLLYEGNSKAKEESTMVMVYNRSLAAYVKHVLPELGIHKVKITTFYDWAIDVIKTELGDDFKLEKKSRQYLAQLLHDIFQKKNCYRTRKHPSIVDYLVIDEAQDFSSMELKAIFQMLDDKNQITIAGDMGQRIQAEIGSTQWHELLEESGLEGVDVLNLTVAYRSTYQIYELAEFIRDPSLQEEDLQLTPKFGPEPVLTICHAFSDAIKLTHDWLDNIWAKNRHVIGAVVCKTSAEARNVFDALHKRDCRGVRLGDSKNFEFTPGITITDVRQVKGLEFSSVLVFNPTKNNYQETNDLDRNLLYVAVTRASYRVDFICYEDVSLLIPSFVSANDLTVLAGELDDKPLFSDVDQDISRFQGSEDETEY